MGGSRPDRRGVVPGASQVGYPQPLGTKIFSGPSFPPEKAVRPTWLCFPFSPLPAWDLGGDSLGTAGLRSRRKEKRSLQVLQDRCDNPHSPGRVGGEREEAGCAKGKLGWGLVQRTHAPPAFHPAPRLSRLPPPSQPGPGSVPVRRISWGFCSCLKKSPSVSKRASTSLVLSKPLPAFRLL